MVWVRLVLFVLGLAAAVAGWFVDQADHFAFARNLADAEAYTARDVLDRLENDQKLVIPAHDDIGAAYLLRVWPKLPKGADLPEGIEFYGVGRSGAYMDLNPNTTARGDVDLRAMADPDNYALKFTWKMSEARIVVDDRIEASALRFGGAMFFGGLTVSTLVGLYEIGVDVRKRRRRNREG